MGQILMHAWLGKMDEVKHGLDEFIRQHEGDPVALYHAASIAAQLVRIRKDNDPVEITGWKQLALQLLRQSYALGYRVGMGMEQDPDFAPLHDDPGFRLLAAGRRVAGEVYATVYQEYRRDADLESSCDWDRTPEEQQQAARDHVTDGVRPMAVAAYVLLDKSAVRTTTVWHRPRSPFPRCDPVQRTAFIDHFLAWPGQVEKLADVLHTCDDTSLRSGMCLAIGSMKEPSTDAKEKWQGLWAQWHVHQPDRGMHSATGWALGKWNAPLPEVPEQRSSRAGFDWALTQMGLTLIRIPAGEVEGATDFSGEQRGERIRVREEYWLSDREVTAGQFLQFLNDNAAEDPFQEIINVYGVQRNRADDLRRICGGGPSLPVGGVNWYDAVMFCNWLSRREGREPCYKKEGKEQILDPNGRMHIFDAWRLISGANGYRLPTADEWEYACRARTTTAFCFGDAEGLLEHYAWFLKNSKDDPNLARCPSSVCTKLCNGWGLFDMHGNVQEWCQDWGREGPGFYRVSRGGHGVWSTRNCSAATEGGSVPFEAVVFDGFRVAIGPMSPARAAAHN